MSCKGPDYSTANFRRGARRGGTYGVDLEIYAGPDAISPGKEGARGWCINCGQKLNWINCKPPFLCHRCQDLQREEYLILFANSQGIIGIPAKGAAVQFPDLLFVREVRKNGRLVTTSL